MTCRSCDAKLSPVGDRHSEGHASIRFGDHALHVWKGDRLLRDCYEVEARLGLAWRYETPLRMCECGAGPAAYIDHGDFRVTTCLPQSPDSARNHVSGPQNACSVSEWPEHTFGGLGGGWGHEPLDPQEAP